LRSRPDGSTGPIRAVHKLFAPSHPNPLLQSSGIASRPFDTRLAGRHTGLMRKLWLLAIPLVVVSSCHSDKIAGSVTLRSFCAGQTTTGTASNPTTASEVVEVDVRLAEGPTGQQMVVGPGGTVPFTIKGCGMVSSKVVEVSRVVHQPGAPTLPPIPATVPGAPRTHG
jgi:hypothetical protein